MGKQSYHRVSGGLMTSVKGFGWQRLPQMFVYSYKEVKCHPVSYAHFCSYSQLTDCETRGNLRVTLQLCHLRCAPSV